MRFSPILLAGLLFAASLVSRADAGQVQFKFLNATEGAKFMGTQDSFSEVLNDFDRAVRVGDPKGASLSQYLEYASQQARDWSEAEIQAVTKATEEFNRILDEKKMVLPSLPEILLVKTTGNDDLSVYTRNNAIIVYPWLTSAQLKPLLMTIIAHEVFHILSRNHPEIRETLYSFVHYQPCKNLAPSEDVNRWIYTNPDAFHYDHYIEVTHGSQKIKVMPFYVRKIEMSQVTPKTKKGFSFLDRLLMKVEVKDGACFPVIQEGKPVFIPIQKTDYIKILNADTGYIDHAEEILADEFSLVVGVSQETLKPVTSPLISKVQKFFTKQE